MLAFVRVTSRPMALRFSWVTIVIVAICAIPITAAAQPRGISDGKLVKLAPAVSPIICLASAIEGDDGVVIRISASEIRLVSTPPDDRDAKGWVSCWTEMPALTLGRQVKAFNSAGESIGKDDLLRTLAEPVPVVCFQRAHKDDPAIPDTLFSEVFRDDVVMFVFEAKHWLR